MSAPLVWFLVLSVLASCSVISANGTYRTNKAVVLEVPDAQVRLIPLFNLPVVRIEPHQLILHIDQLINSTRNDAILLSDTLRKDTLVHWFPEVHILHGSLTLFLLLLVLGIYLTLYCLTRRSRTPTVPTALPHVEHIVLDSVTSVASHSALCNPMPPLAAVTSSDPVVSAPTIPDPLAPVPQPRPGRVGASAFTSKGGRDITPLEVLLKPGKDTGSANRIPKKESSVFPPPVLATQQAPSNSRDIVSLESDSDVESD
jgi:hypothetical protein